MNTAANQELPMTRMTAEKANALRARFGPEQIGKLPKPYDKNAPKKNCQECGGYHSPGIHAPFVGHAVVTDRLLTIDPYWTWRPYALNEQGLPAVSREGDLWIVLTLCGVERIGVGDGPTMKIKVGDGIRNAAMRFGVALALWAKDELEFAAIEGPAAPVADEAPSRSATTQLRAMLPPDGVDPVSGEIETEAAYAAAGGQDPSPIEPRQMKALQAGFRDAGISDRNERLAYCGWATGQDGPIESTKLLTKEEASTVITSLKDRMRENPS